VNAWLAQLLERQRTEARKVRLAREWVAYAADVQAQDGNVEYALAAQGELGGEPPAAPSRAGKPARKAPVARRSKGRTRP
jgi:hypothetical protein